MQSYHLLNTKPFVLVGRMITPLCFGLVLSVSAFASPLGERVNNADGLLGFIFNSPGKDHFPVEKMPPAGGKVVSAHAVKERNTLRVSGLVARDGGRQAPLDAHVDITIHDANGRIVAADVTNFYPRILQVPSSRYGPGYSRYSSHFPNLPKHGSTVRVSFHSVQAERCEFAQQIGVRAQTAAHATSRSLNTATAK